MLAGAVGRSAVRGLIAALAGIGPCSAEPLQAQSATPASADAARQLCDSAFVQALDASTGARRAIFAAAREEWTFYGRQVVAYDRGATSGEIVAPGWLENGDTAPTGTLPPDWETAVQAPACKHINDRLKDGDALTTDGEQRILRIQAYWSVVHAAIRDGRYEEPVSKPDRYATYHGCSMGIAWSAAFISYLMEAGGLTRGSPVRFVPAPAHVQYLKAIDRDARTLRRPAYTLSTVRQSKPMRGDLVCAMRYDEDAATGTSRPSGFSRDTLRGSAHCDLVVGVQKDRVIAIGGNVAQSVSCSLVELSPTGFLPTENLGSETVPPYPARPWRVIARWRLPP